MSDGEFDWSSLVSPKLMIGLGIIVVLLIEAFRSSTGGRLAMAENTAPPTCLDLASAQYHPRSRLLRGTPSTSLEPDGAAARARKQAMTAVKRCTPERCTDLDRDKMKSAAHEYFHRRAYEIVDVYEHYGKAGMKYAHQRFETFDDHDILKGLRALREARLYDPGKRDGRVGMDTAVMLMADPKARPEPCHEAEARNTNG